MNTSLGTPLLPYAVCRFTGSRFGGKVGVIGVGIDQGDLI